MSGIVQHKSAQATTQNVTVTFDAPVSQGNLIVAFIGWFGGGGNNFEGFAEDSNPSPSFTSLGEVVGIPDGLEAYWDLAPSSGTYTLTAEFSANDGTGRHLHVFEISGYDTPDQTGENNQVSNAPSVTTTSNTSSANELVLAAFLDITHVGESFTAGAGFTAAETTNTNSLSMFSEYQTISSAGKPSASASIAQTDTVISMVVTFYDSSDTGGSSGGGGGTSSSTFLGSVTEVSDVEGTDVFLGTVSVLSVAPNGVPCPYLGKVRVVTAPTGRSNPTLGQVIVLSSAPANEANEWLGSVATS